MTPSPMARLDYHAFTTEYASFAMINSEMLIAAFDGRREYGHEGIPGLGGEVQAEAEKQWTWLEAALAAATTAHVIPVMHHPPFLETPAEPDQYFNWPAAPRARLLALFERYGVTDILCGHTHTTTVVSAGGFTVHTVAGTAKALDDNGCGYKVVARGGRAIKCPLPSAPDQRYIRP